MWINIKDQKPTHKQKVLIYVENLVTAASVDTETVTGYTYWDAIGFDGYDMETLFNGINVTHWMPLPEPP